jgi:hypothetical protein
MKEMNRRSGGQERILETIRLHWRRLLPFGLVTPVMSAMLPLLEPLNPTLAVVIFSIIFMPFFFWSFLWACGVSASGQVSHGRVFLLIMVPHLPLAFISFYLLQLARGS